MKVGSGRDDAPATRQGALSLYADLAFDIIYIMRTTNRLLREAELRRTNWPHQHLGILRRHLDRLTNLEAGRPRHCRRNSYGEAVTPRPTRPPGPG